MHISDTWWNHGQIMKRCPEAYPLTSQYSSLNCLCSACCSLEWQSSFPLSWTPLGASPLATQAWNKICLNTIECTSQQAIPIWNEVSLSVQHIRMGHISWLSYIHVDWCIGIRYNGVYSLWHTLTVMNQLVPIQNVCLQHTVTCAPYQLVGNLHMSWAPSTTIHVE